MSANKRTRTAREYAIWLFRRHRNANMLAVAGPNAFVMVLDNVKSDFNIGKIFRSADAFGAREIHLIGVDFFDPSPASGSFKWVPAKFHTDFYSCHQDLQQRGYTLFMMDPEQGEPLWETNLPRKSAFIVGHEQYGISFDKTEYSGVQALSIPQFGKVQSLNVSVAASIVMYEYLQQHRVKIETGSVS